MLTDKLSAIESTPKSYFTDPRIFKSLGISFLINIIHFCLLYFKLGVSKATVLIHYNVVYGPDVVQREWFVYFIPGISLLFLLINTIFSRYFYNREKLAAYFINYSNLALQIIFLAASIIVIRSNA